MKKDVEILFLSENLRRLRSEKKLTLEATSQLTGVSKSMLAQIEQGKVNPTISVLWKICNGLKVSFTSLMEPLARETHVIRLEEQRPLSQDDGRYLNYPVFIFDERTRFETYRIVIKNNGKLTSEPHLKGTEEDLTVFRGNVRITANGKTFDLKAGDSIAFKADCEHSYENIGHEDVELSMLIYYS